MENIRNIEKNDLIDIDQIREIFDSRELNPLYNENQNIIETHRIDNEFVMNTMTHSNTFERIDGANCKNFNNSSNHNKFNTMPQNSSTNLIKQFENIDNHIMVYTSPSQNRSNYLFNNEAIPQSNQTERVPSSRHIENIQSHMSHSLHIQNTSTNINHSNLISSSIVVPVSTGLSNHLINNLPNSISTHNNENTINTSSENNSPQYFSNQILQSFQNDINYAKSPSIIPVNGIDMDRICGYNKFMKDIFQRIQCSICTLIPFDPLECKNCSTIVCKSCIEKWDKKECIVRCGGDGYETPSRILRDIINGIVIKCRNILKGCDENLKIDRLKTHEGECDFEEIKCPFSDCTLLDIRKNVNIHIENCEYNKIKCIFCKNSYRKSEFDRHIEKDCEEVLMECSECGKSERRKDFRLGIHNCVHSLKEEIKDLNKSINNMIENYDALKLTYEELKRQSEEDKKNFIDKKTLMYLYINLLKSNYDPIFEDIVSKIKPYNLFNPMQIPYIFRFMTSSRTLQITNLADYTFCKINLNINFEIPTSHQSIVTSNKRIFIVGGVNHEKKTYEFDILNKTMIEKADMNIGRRRHILTELRSGVFIATGGSNQNEEVLRDCEAYLMGKNQWVKISSLNIPRFYHTAFSFNNTHLYVIGGCHTNNSSLVNLNSIERIELSYELNGSWEILSVKDLNLLKPRSRLSYLFIDSQKILLFGGIPDYQPVLLNINNQEITLADNQFYIEGRFFFNDRCTWHQETLFISSQSSRCIFNHSTNSWEIKEFNEEGN